MVCICGWTIRNRINDFLSRCPFVSGGSLRGALSHDTFRHISITQQTCGSRKAVRDSSGLVCKEREILSLRLLYVSYPRRTICKALNNVGIYRCSVLMQFYHRDTHSARTSSRCRTSRTSSSSLRNSMRAPEVSPQKPPVTLLYRTLDHPRLSCDCLSEMSPGRLNASYVEETDVFYRSAHAIRSLVFRREAITSVHGHLSPCLIAMLSAFSVHVSCLT